MSDQNHKTVTARNNVADLMKGIAVVLMVQVHLVELFARDEIFNSSLGSILLFLGGPPAAPVFMVIMGYFLAKSKKTIQQDIIRGIKLIALGILLNAAINFHLFIKIFFGGVQLDPLPYLFGADILPLAGISIILIAFVKKYFGKNLIVMLVFILIMIILSEYLNRLGDTPAPMAYLQAFFFGHLQWSYFPLLPWIVYPLSGFIFRLASDKIIINESTTNFAVIFACIISVSTISYGIETASNLKEYYHHNWIYIFWNIQFLLIAAFLSQKIITYADDNLIVRYLRWVGRNVTLVYVIQWIIIGNIATAVFRTQNEVMLLLWFILILSGVSILAYGFSKDRSFN